MHGIENEGKTQGRAGSTIESIFERLAVDGWKPEWAGEDRELINGQCPTHDDQSKSLVIGQTLDGTIFVKCYGGCSSEDILRYVTRDESLTFESDDGRLIDTGGLLRAVSQFVEKYVVLTDSQGVALALWVVHTHAIEAAHTTPFLSITSAEKECGKTRLLEVLEVLVASPWFTMRTTAAALVRKTDAELPTLLLDESDAAFRGDRDYAEALRGVLNSGYRRGGKATMCVGQGAKIDTRDFSTFGPKAIAGIGDLPDTVASRSIPVRLKRRAAGEHVEYWGGQHRVKVDAAPLREQLVVWAGEHADKLAVSEPLLVEGLSDRAAECWEPLLAIADQAGGDWPRRARDAALALSAAATDQAASRGVQLLGAIRDAMGGAPVAFTSELVKAINADDELPFGALRDGKGLDGSALARLLKPYGIKPRGTVRIGDATAKGYHAEDLADAWDRYLPPPQASQASQPSHAHQQSPQTAHEHRDVTDVTDVTDSAGGGGK